MTTNVNNQGIAHVAFRAGGMPLCRNGKGHQSYAIADFRQNTGPLRYSARCVAKVAKMDAVKARNETRIDAKFAALRAALA